MTNKEAFLAFNKALNEAIIKQQAMKEARASGNFEQFIQSDASIKTLEDDHFTKLGTEYTKEIDVGRSAGKIPPIQPLFEWVGRKKYGITFSTEQEQRSIAWAIAKTMAKRGGYKRRNTDKHTDIINTAIEESKPTLFKLLAESSILGINSQVQREVKLINAKK